MDDKTKAFPKANVSQHGMDLLDYFAAKAMSGDPFGWTDNKNLAKRSYDIAEAMMNERKKRQDGQD